LTDGPSKAADNDVSSRVHCEHECSPDYLNMCFVSIGRH
jgi:hypothetical protein